MTADRITIPQTGPCIDAATELYGTSALAYCARMRSGDGDVYLEADRPVATLSSGEQVLWQSFAALMDDSFDREAMEAASRVLDSDNADALKSAWATATIRGKGYAAWRDATVMAPTATA